MYVVLAGQAIIYTALVVIVAKAKGKSAESFLSGGRTIGHGMINASIIATWIWAATLMISSWTGFSYGFAGPWWYALGATIPLPFMAYIGRQIKTVMPNATSYPEFILFRSNKANHLLHSIITLIVCFWVTLMIVTGSSVMLVSFTGCSYLITSALLIIIFVSYISFAGLWASVFADTIMCLVMYACLFVVQWGIITNYNPADIWAALQYIQTATPVLQDKQVFDVSLSQWDNLNWFNSAGIGFLIVNTIGNLGAVICNQTYWSRMTGSKDPATAFKSFLTAGYCWWPIPFATATCAGVVGLSMGLTVGEFYTSPTGEVMLFTEAEAVLPTVSFIMLGYLGLVLIIIAVGGACISTGAGEILAMITVFVNDLYRGYMNPGASDKQVLRLSRILLFVCAALVLAVVMYWRIIGFSFSGMYQAMGVAFSSAVVPLWCFAMWKKTNKAAAFWGVIIGGVLGLVYWIFIAKFDLLWGVVWGNVIVLGVSTIIVIVGTMIKPEPFDFATLKDQSFHYGSIEEMLIVSDDMKVK